MSEEGEVAPLQRLMTAKLVDVLKLCDRHGYLQTMQNDLLHNLFGTLKRSLENVQPSKQTIGDVFKEMPVASKGELTSGIVPSS
jgi:hypothetical protein